uniref:F-box/LRR-repeat protein 15/At3g58940/PEG3-like LRR domain-containing protein n=1 Tax=Setaria italica TaxID=4555 RepID=K4A0W2_SETIT
MGTDHGDLVGAGEDRISGLPDHLLHRILLGHPDLSTFDAARTSVLSRQWRRVWADLPDLSFSYSGEPGSYARTHDRIDTALDAYSAPAAKCLRISVPLSWTCRVPVNRVASWLRFASRRLAGELRLSLRFGKRKNEEEELVIPLCERATAIRFMDLGCTLRFRLPPVVGAFAALATLGIRDASLDGRELDDILSSRCPRLKELVLEGIILPDGDAAVLSIRSNSLEYLKSPTAAAPKLKDVYCYNNDYGYDPSRHRFVEAGKHLRRLAIKASDAALMRQFNAVDELVLDVYLPK